MNIDKNKKTTQLITEMLSISDEVTATSDMIYADAEKNIQNYPYRKQKDGVFIRMGSETYNLWGYNIKAEIIIYDFTDKDLFDKEKDSINYVNHFDPHNLTIRVTFVALLGTIYRPNSEDALYHEVEHTYQWCLNKNNNPNFKMLTDAAYYHATKILNSKQNGDDYNLAWAMYYANPREQDAFANEYYVQSRQSYQNFLLGETEVDKRLKDFEGVVRWLQKNFNNSQVRQCMNDYQIYGYNPNNIMKFVEKGLARFKNKLSHVRKLINITTNERIPRNSNIPIDRFSESKEALAQRITEDIIQKLRKG